MQFVVGTMKEVQVAVGKKKDRVLWAKEMRGGEGRKHLNWAFKVEQGFGSRDIHKMHSGSGERKCVQNI